MATGSLAGRRATRPASFVLTMLQRARRPRSCRFVPVSRWPIRLRSQRMISRTAAGENMRIGGARRADHRRRPQTDCRQQIAIEVTHSPDPLSSFAMRTDADGTFRTPAQFPKPLAYRLVVRTILVDVASSVWLCPAASGNQFPDVVVERSKLRLDSKLSGNEIVAVLNGEPIQASLALERAFCAPLRPDRMTLWSRPKGSQPAR